MWRLEVFRFVKSYSPATARGFYCLQVADLIFALPAYQAQNIDFNQRTRSSKMLQFTRKQYESIIIGDDIKVTVLSDKHGRVRLGIEAPDDVEIWRDEIQETNN